MKNRNGAVVSFEPFQAHTIFFGIGLVNIGMGLFVVPFFLDAQEIDQIARRDGIIHIGNDTDMVTGRKFLGEILLGAG